MSRCVLGVDLGGTNVRAQAFREGGMAAGERVERPSRAQDGLDAAVGALAETILQAMSTAQSKPESIGIAVPGHVDNSAGLVRWAPNFGETVDGVFRYWENVPLRSLLAEAVDVPVHMGNDANLAALGEYRFGFGEGVAHCLVLFTIGTGIGGGVVLGERAVQGECKGPLILVGGNCGGGELGHTAILYGGLDCPAGSYGAIEGYCQRDAIVRRATHRMNRGRDTLLHGLTGGNPSKVTPRLIFEAAEMGDELAIEVWSEVGTYLGVGIGNMINVFAPDVVAVGGKIALAGEWLLGPARNAARNVAVPSLFRDTRIVQAKLIDDAGLMGAAALALEASTWN